MRLTAGFVSLCWFAVDVNRGVCLSVGLVLTLTAGLVSLYWFGVDVNSGACLPLLVLGLDVSSGGGQGAYAK